MSKSDVFGAARATAIAALCAGAGLALAGCEAKAEKAPETPAGKPAADPAKQEPATEKPGGENQCGGDHKCGGAACGAKK